MQPISSKVACYLINYYVVIGLCCYCFVGRQDFIIQSPLPSNEFGVGVFLGPNITRSCINITAIDDDVPENPVNTVQFVIEIFEDLRLLVFPPAQVVTVNILDDDCKFAILSLYCGQSPSNSNVRSPLNTYID